MSVYGGIPALLHNDIVEADDGVHRGADLVGHVGQELALGNIRFFRLLPHPLDLVDICLDVGHIQDQNDAALFPPAFINNLLAVALIVLSVHGKAPGDVLVEHFLPELLQHPDIFPQLMLGQAGQDLGRGPVVADQPVVVVQRNHAVAQVLQHLLRRQMAEIIAAPAPRHNHHQRHGGGQRHRSEIEHHDELAHIGDKHHNGQEGNAQNRPILTVDLLV